MEGRLPDNFPGQAALSDLGSHQATHQFLIEQMLGRLWTVTLVKVMACTNDGGLSAVGSVDVQPLVAAIDAAGTVQAHGTIYNIPYFRIQGGSNAVILDPVDGDIGLCCFASRDISAVKANKAPSAPGSFRRFDAADGLYLGGFLNGAPTTYLQFDADGNINVVTPSGKAVAINCGTATITADHANIISDDVNLGAAGGAAVARVGDSVAGGVITSGSSKVKCS